MPDSAVVYPLAMLTLIALVVFAFWQLYRVNVAKKNDTHSALADHPDPELRGEPVTRPGS